MWAVDLGTDFIQKVSGSEKAGFSCLTHCIYKKPVSKIFKGPQHHLYLQTPNILNPVKYAYGLGYKMFSCILLTRRPAVVCWTTEANFRQNIPGIVRSPGVDHMLWISHSIYTWPLAAVVMMRSKVWSQSLKSKYLPVYPSKNKRTPDRYSNCVQITHDSSTNFARAMSCLFGFWEFTRQIEGEWLHKD